MDTPTHSLSLSPVILVGSLRVPLKDLKTKGTLVKTARQILSALFILIKMLLRAPAIYKDLRTIQATSRYQTVTLKELARPAPNALVMKSDLQAFLKAETIHSLAIRKCPFMHQGHKGLHRNFPMFPNTAK